MANIKRSFFDKNNWEKGMVVNAFYNLNYNQFDMTPHIHTNAEIMYVQYGKATILYSYDDVTFESVDLSANQYIFIDSAIKHKLIIETPKTSILNCEMSFTDSAIQSFKLKDLCDKDPDFKNFLNSNIKVFKALDNHFVLESIQLIQKYMLITDPKDVSKLKTSSMLATLMLCIGNSYTEQFKNIKKSRLNTAVNYIHTHFAENLTMKEIADMCNISCNYLNTLFKQSFYVCVTDYINDYRIKKACEKISRNDMPINLIIGEVGFNNKMTFNRNFLKFVGTTPGQYKKNLRKKSYEVILSKNEIRNA